MKHIIFKWGLFVWMSVVIVLAFTLSINIPILKETSRNIFFHVAMAITATVAYMTSAWFGLQYIRHKDLMYDMKLEASVSLGFLFSILSTITGMIWAKYSWGKFWNWDPRETSNFILLLIYSSLLILRSTSMDKEKIAKLSSAYAVFSFFPMIFLVFVLPRLTPGLHPGSDKGDVNPAFSTTTSTEIRLVLYASWIGFIMLFAWMFQLKCKMIELRERISVEK